MQAMESIQKTSISEQVFVQLRERILKKVLPVGADLPSERELSETLGVNRGAVREAIKRLQQAPVGPCAPWGCYTG
jgi:GntR family transcriptional repressor for pyruvate dehydrogenase complex